jgi:basic amino acid/polyamine antiporter, APA family
MSEDQDARRGLGLLHVYAICTGAMFSSGFFLLPGLAVELTGGSVPVAYLLAGLLVLPAMLSTAELATAFPRAGGPYHFLHRSMGPAVALIGALGLWVAMVLKAAFALVGIGVYLTLLVEVPGELVAIGLAIAFTGLNIAGARESARLQVVLVATLLMVLAGFLVAGTIELLGTGAEELDEAFSPLLTEGALGLFGASAMVFVAYAGLLQVASMAGEVRNPDRTIIRGLLLSLATATVVYVVGTALMVGLLGTDELAGDEAPVATTVDLLMIPFGLVLIVGAALAAFASTGNAGIMSAARYPLALARDRMLWGRFARLNQRGAPTLAVLLTGAATIGVIVTFDVDGIAKLASAFLLVVFALLNVAVIVLRRGRVAGYRPGFQSPLFPWVQWFGVVAAVALVIDLGLVPAFFSGGVTLVGAIWFAVLGRRRTDERGALIHIVQRARTGIADDSDIAELQEHGPRADDHAPELLDGASIVQVEGSDGLARTRDEAARQVAERVQAAPGETGAWLDGRSHLAIHLDEPVSELHHVQLDWAEESFAVVAWAPGDGKGEGVGWRRGPTTAVIAGPHHERERCLRVLALLTTQLGDDRLDQHWPAGDGSPEEVAEAVRKLLAGDAAERQGGEARPDERAHDRTSPSDD